jgi:ankyrin repeat protein
MKKTVLLVLAFAALAAASPARAELDLSPRRAQLLQAIAANDADKVREMLVRGENPNTVDLDGRTALILAAGQGNSAIVQMLIDQKARVAAADKNGGTALHWAAERGHAEVVRLLLAAKAGVDAENKRGATPLMLGAASGSPEVVNLLLAAGADSRRQDYTGRSAVDYAQDKRNSRIVQLLQTTKTR